MPMISLFYCEMGSDLCLLGLYNDTGYAILTRILSEILNRCSGEALTANSIQMIGKADLKYDQT